MRGSVRNRSRQPGGRPPHAPCAWERTEAEGGSLPFQPHTHQRVRRKRAPNTRGRFFRALLGEFGHSPPSRSAWKSCPRVLRPFEAAWRIQVGSPWCMPPSTDKVGAEPTGPHEKLPTWSEAPARSTHRVLIVAISASFGLPAAHSNAALEPKRSRDFTVPKLKETLAKLAA